MRSVHAAQVMMLPLALVGCSPLSFYVGDPRTGHFLHRDESDYGPTRPEQPDHEPLTAQGEIAALGSAIAERRLVEAFYFADLSHGRSEFDRTQLGEAGTMTDPGITDRIQGYLRGVASEADGLRGFARIVGRPSSGRSRTLTEALLGPRAMQPARRERSGLETVRNALGENEALLAFAEGPDGRVWAFLVTPAELHVHELALDRVELTALVGRARERILEGLEGGVVPGSLVADLVALRDVLLEPFAPWLDGLEALAIVPGPTLQNVPFTALARWEQGRPVYLVDEPLLVSIIPSPAALVSLKRRRLERLRSAGATATRDVKALFVGDPEGASVHLPPLPSARAEVEVLRHVYADAVLLVGSAATEHAVVAAATSATVIHLATHGIVFPEDPLSSCVLLGAGGGQDGLLTVREVIALDLRADLVTLSACETGAAAAVAEGHATASLAGAFLEAGAGAVIASSWPVESTSTALFMLEVYRRLGDGPTPRALREAARLVKSRPRFAHPYFWAAFALHGDPR